MKMKYFFSGCFITMLFYTQINAQCNIDIEIAQFPDTICSGTGFTLVANVGTSGVTYKWSGPAGFNRTGQNETVTNATGINSGIYKVVGTKAGCPSDSDTINITVHIPPAKPVINAGVPMCIGDTLYLNTTPSTGGTGLKTKIWGPAGFNDTLLLSHIPLAGKANTGEYNSVHIDTFGCVSDTGSVTIAPTDINTRPATPVVSSNSPLCKGDTLKIFSTPAGIGEDYNWIGPFVGQIHTQNILQANYISTGRHTYILTVDSMGCHSIPDTAIIDVYPVVNPTVSISAKPGFYIGQYTPVTLTANILDSSINVSYQWRKNGKDIPGEVFKTLNLVFGVDIQQGEFISVWVSSGPTCSPTDTVLSAFVAFTPNSVDELKTSNLAIYPNPVNDMLVVKGIQQQEIHVSTITGATIVLPVKNEGNNMHINTTQLPSGIYLIRIGDKAARFMKE